MVSMKTKPALIADINDLLGAVKDKFEDDEDGDAERDYMVERCPRRLRETLQTLPTLALHLLAHLEGGPTGVVGLAARSGQLKGTVSKHVQRLVGAGLVVRTPVPGNRKEVELALTGDGELVARGFLPADFPMTGGALSALAAVSTTGIVAVVSALLAARRVTAIRPTEALGETAVEPARSGKVRFGFGLATLVAALAASVVSVGATGQVALTGAIGMLYLFVLTVALLAPWINRFAARLLAPVLRTVWGAGGYLASANLRANAQGMAAVLTALVLSVGFGGSVWFLQNNLERHTVTESREGMLAQNVLISPVGLPGTAADTVRHIAGVQAVTAVRHTSVIVKNFDGAAAVTAQAIDPGDATATMDLKVSAGTMTALNRQTVAVSGLQAASQGWQVGDRVSFWLGDGTPVTLFGGQSGALSAFVIASLMGRWLPLASA